MAPLPRAPRNKRFLIVTIDYFTKWIEAEPFPIFGMWMLRVSSGKTFLLGLGYPRQSFKITEPNLKANFLKDSARI